MEGHPCTVSPSGFDATRGGQYPRGHGQDGPAFRGRHSRNPVGRSQADPRGARGVSADGGGAREPERGGSVMTDPTAAKSLVYRLPRKVDFPFGYEISVVQGTPDKDDRAAEWDVDTRTIVVDRRLPPAEKRGAFLHELDHAWNDWKLWVAQTVPVRYPDAMDPDPAEQDDEPLGDPSPPGAA